MDSTGHTCEMIQVVCLCVCGPISLHISVCLLCVCVRQRHVYLCLSLSFHTSPSFPLSSKFSCLAAVPSVPSLPVEQPTLQGPGPLPRARAGPLVSLQLFVTEGYEQRQTGPCAITADNRVYVEVSLPSYVCVFNCVSICLSACLPVCLPVCLAADIAPAANATCVSPSASLLQYQLPQAQSRLPEGYYNHI